MTLNSVQDHFQRYNTPDHQIDYTFYTTNEDISYRAGLLSGIRYFPFKNIGVYVDGGLGPIGNINFGITTRY